MSVEMAAVTFEGTHTAERELSALRSSRNDPWLEEVAVLERHKTDRYSIKAANPDFGDSDHVGAGIALGGGTGLLLGLVGGPLGLVFWGAVGALSGGLIGSRHDDPGPLGPLVQEVKNALSVQGSALMLVADTATTDQLITALGPKARFVIREPLTDEQLDHLTRAAKGT
jgi:uncharacterized membrane protein